MVGCPGESPPDNRTATRVLDNDSLRDLLAVDADGTLWFRAAATILNELEPGDVVVIGESPLTPHGFLGRVESVTPREDRVGVATSPARLQDAIESGHVAALRQLNMSDVTEVMMLQNGITFESESTEKSEDEPLEPGEGMLIGFQDLRIQGDGGELIINGSVSVRPSFEITLDIDGFALTEASLSFRSDQGLALSIEATGNGQLQDEIPLLRIVFGAITIPVGPVPVVLTPVLTVSLTAAGEISAGLRASVTQSSSAEIGFGYIDGELDAFENTDFTLTSDTPSAEAEASARVGAGGRFAVLLYGATGPYAQASGFLEARALVQAAPMCVSWELAAGVEADVGIEFIADVETRVLDDRTVLESFDCATDPPPVGPAALAMTYGGAAGENPVAVIPTADEGYVLVAATASFHAPFPATWIAKVDRGGTIEWEQALRGIGRPATAQARSGGFVVASGTVGTGARDSFISAFRDDGELLWSRQWTAAVPVALHALRVRDDGTMVVAGSAGATDPDVWVALFETHGSVRWSRTYGGAGTEVANAVVVTGDGGFAIAGETQDSFGEAAESRDYWVLKLDAMGEVAWQYRYGGDGSVAGQNDSYENATAIVEMPDGSLVVTGSSLSFGSRAPWTLRLNRDGTPVWSTSFDGGWTSTNVNALLARPDGSVTVGGRGGDSLQSTGLWLFRLDASGVLAWSKAYGGTGRERLGSGLSTYDAVGDPLASTMDGGIVAVGTSNSFGDGDDDAWLLKLTPTAEVVFRPDIGAEIANQSAGFTQPQQIKAVATAAIPTDLALTSTDVADEIARVDTDVSIGTQSL